MYFWIYMIHPECLDCDSKDFATCAEYVEKGKCEYKLKNP